MLEELHVHNYAIIDKLQVRFTGGLNVLSGETGAGKSILIGALGLLLGDKTDTSIIRVGGGGDERLGNRLGRGERGGGRSGWPRAASSRRRGRSSCAGC